MAKLVWYALLLRMPLNASDLESILKRVHDWTWRIDTKVQIFVALEAFSLGAIVPKVTGWVWQDGRPLTLKALAYFGLGMLAVSIGKNVQALFPRGVPFDLQAFLRDELWELLKGLFQSTGRKPRTSTSFTYFGHIGATPIDEYRRRVNAVDREGEELREEFITQIHVCSVIVNRKLHDLKVSVVAYLTGLAVLGIAYLYS